MNFGYDRVEETIPVPVPTCQESVGGVDGTEYNLREPLLPDCPMCATTVT